jgi:hypothetical protein
MVYGVDDILLIVDRDRVDLRSAPIWSQPLPWARTRSTTIPKPSFTRPAMGSKPSCPAMRGRASSLRAVSLHTTDNLLLVTDRSASAERLARNLISICRDQADN